jgi:HSP20 family protein
MFGNLSNFEGSLFDELRRMERDRDLMFSAWPWTNGIRTVARGTYPPINIGSTPEQVDVYLFAAGIDPKSLDISIQRNLLTIDGKRKLTAEQGADYFRNERFSGEFHRVITLPDDVDPEAVEANYRDGILRITIQRHEAAKPRQIEVH